MLDSTNLTNYYLTTNFTDIKTGKVLDSPAYAAYVFFFDPLPQLCKALCRLSEGYSEFGPRHPIMP
ncbi:hypothetical protein BC938DRAFT_482488 [Jimgerdemannia flammicorona]|uniref:Uncharacterized protein n=1 Tax=Jimgerdemannia flammicorona TaxID=994334 RepID=A0A433QE00_9FUNG|nr:hypothetical protein BC938DRAFT_482488 [Jimgerdemannia flammicorona]